MLHLFSVLLSTYCLVYLIRLNAPSSAWIQMPRTNCGIARRRVQRVESLSRFSIPFQRSTSTSARFLINRPAHRSSKQPLVITAVEEWKFLDVLSLSDHPSITFSFHSLILPYPITHSHSVPCFPSPTNCNAALHAASVKTELADLRLFRRSSTAFFRGDRQLHH